MKKILSMLFAACFALCVMPFALSDTAFADATINGNDDWNGGTTLTETATWTFSNGATLTLKEPVTIPSGITLTLKGWGTVARYSAGENANVNALFVVQAGGKLVIEGTSKEKPFTIDGKNVIASASLIISSGALEFENAVIQNGKNRSVYAENHTNAGKPNGQGGGITVGITGSLTMENCVVTKNTASLNGGGIYSTGPITVKNSEISWNRAMSAETAYSTVNAGRGGGFALSGENADGVFENVLVTQNAAMYYGGGGQVSGLGSSLTMSGNTVFSYNTAVLHGAGALHLTGDATFTMDGGSMENNFAQYCGGAIHSSYSCTLNLNSGTISNNTSNGRGAGVHVNTGGAIVLGEGLTISGNKVYSQGIGSYAELDATGDNWSNVKYEGHSNDFGYGGGVLIDSGTCTVAGATITDNYALNGGGGIALTMLNMGEGGLDDYMVINFEMTSGVVSGNTTDGDGAGIYIMTNKAEENLKEGFPVDAAEKNYQWALDKITETNKHGFTGQQIIDGIPEAVVSGGSIENNIAQGNGGGLYLGEETKFIINGGSISQNSATDGAGAYIESGSAEIHGGTMSGNAASGDGGAIYVNGTVVMTDGSVESNGTQRDGEGGVLTETERGGAIFVTGGSFEMSGGSFSDNGATDGGAVYMDGGDFTMAHGAVSGNIAADDGGAVYMAGTSAVFSMQSGEMNDNSAGDDGGAVYATGGTLYIGLKDCDGTDADLAEHTALGAGRHHPELVGNEAADCGGGIAVSKSSSAVAVVHFYCGDASENEALYKGVGKNVFMDGGDVHLYEGAHVGLTHDPDLVIVGGTLYNEGSIESGVELAYYRSNADGSPSAEGLAELGEHMNLPDGEYFFDAPIDGYVFFGWTPHGYNSDEPYVRNEGEYLPSGTPVEAIDLPENSSEVDQGTFDGTADSTMNLYALWAPPVSSITYAGHVVDGAFSDSLAAAGNPVSYSFSYTASSVRIEAPAKPGYELVGWYIYQNEGQNANWGYEPVYKADAEKIAANLDFSKLEYIEVSNDNDSLDLQVKAMAFGNITLIAKYEPIYGTIEIAKSFPTGASYTIDADQPFVFRITGETDDADLPAVDMDVVVYGKGSVTVKLPAGDYTVTEDVSWSWRYACDEPAQTADIDVQDEKVELAYTNTQTSTYWLNFFGSKLNVFAA